MKGSITKRTQTAIISIAHSLMMDQHMKMYECMKSILENTEQARARNSNAR